MTRTNTQRNLIAGSVFGALTTVIMFAQAGHANAATSVLSCEGSNRRAVLECCEERVNKHGLPLWMRQVGAHCSSPKIQIMVKCKPTTYGTAANKHCKIVKAVSEGGGGKHDPKDNGGRDKGGRDNGGRDTKTSKN